ncbi:MAG: hypothetical protein LQ340_002148 [Diploschistes diacapsis]|nr:MAG: hypothetical protein LQ340_002148 [Diploschistes diacapsis]
MSFVIDQVRRIDAQLDQLQFSTSLSPASSLVLRHAATDQRGGGKGEEQHEGHASRVHRLQSVIKVLSTTSSSQVTVPRQKLEHALLEASKGIAAREGGRDSLSAYESDLEWCAIGKAAAQTYGVVLGSFLDEILPLSNDIWYWDDILGSYTYSSLYTIQMSPLRFWAWSKGVYRDARERFQDMMNGDEMRISQSATARWRQFYELVRESIHDRSIAHLRSKFLSPITEAQLEARTKQKNLKRIRDLSSSALGILMDEGFSFEIDEFGAAVENGWQQNLSKSVILMDAVLQRLAASPDISTHDIEEQSFNHVDDYVDDEGSDWSQPPALARNLLDIVITRLPAYQKTMQRQVVENGKPSHLVRYWLPATALLLSSSTILRIFFNRREAILSWVRELGTTVQDFWYNWVVEPVKRLIGTIRHDEKSEIAIMSKESLQGDRASLERMVVDFAVENSTVTGGKALNEVEIAAIRSKVSEGDLTPVLKAYEKDLQKPFLGAIRGQLVRALLIQIQKTKVDVELAISGIDALLKSQELVFGFVGLTPSILICLGLSRWLTQSFATNRRNQEQQHSRMSRVLRNIDRVLTLSRPTPNHTIPYKDRGLLLCEVHVLRQIGQAALPIGVRRDFLEDLNDLVESRTGVSGQLRIVERIRWAYGKYIQ